MTLACNNGYTRSDGGTIVPTYIKIGCRFVTILLSVGDDDDDDEEDDNDDDSTDWTFEEHHPATADAIAFAQILAAVPFHNDQNPWSVMRLGRMRVKDDTSPFHTTSTNDNDDN